MLAIIVLAPSDPFLCPLDPILRAERSLFNPASCDVVRLFFPFGTWATSASSAVAGGAAPRLHVLREVPSYAFREVPSIFWPGTPDVRLFLRGCPFTVNPFSPDFRSNFFLIGCGTIPARLAGLLLS